MSMSIDAEDLLDALAGATPAGRAADGRDRAVPSDAAIEAFGRRMLRFLEELPGDLPIMALREQLEDIGPGGWA